MQELVFQPERIEEIVAGAATPTIKLHYYMLPLGHLSSGEHSCKQHQQAASKYLHISLCKILCGNIKTSKEFIIALIFTDKIFGIGANNLTNQGCVLPFKDRWRLIVCLPTRCWVKKKNLHETPVIHRGIAVAIVTIFIHSFLVNCRALRVRAALDSYDWTRLGPYHTGRRGA